jgi:hypothetical protein
MVRNITRFDYDKIITAMKEFRAESNRQSHLSNDYDLTHITKVLDYCRLSGVCLIAEDADNNLQGFLISAKNIDLWQPDIVRLQELLWWVKPELRDTTIGGRLFLKYKQQAEVKKTRGEIFSYTIGRASITKDIDFSKQGFKFYESLYVIGE